LDVLLELDEQPVQAFTPHADTGVFHFDAQLVLYRCSTARCRSEKHQQRVAGHFAQSSR
jgi:hypothetical protein